MGLEEWIIKILTLLLMEVENIKIYLSIDLHINIDIRELLYLVLAIIIYIKKFKKHAFYPTPALGG